MHKLRIYFDTSIINFLFADDAPEKRDITIEYFDYYVKLNRYEHFISKIVVDEILLSWNYKHLANVNKERQILIANLENGYLKTPRLTNPMEVFND